MLPRRHLLPAAVALLLCVLAGCGSSGSAATPATTPPEPVGGLAGRLSADCKRTLTAYEATSREQIALGARLDRRATALDRRLAREDAEIDEMVPDDDATYAAVDAYNAGVDRYNALDQRLDDLADRQNDLLQQYETTATRCLDQLANWDADTTPLESALAAPARAAGSDEPSITCDQPYVRVTPLGPDEYEDQGFVYDDETVIHLTARVCLDLERVLLAPGSLACAKGAEARYATCTPGAEDALIAIATLAHEQQHVDGIADEAKAECYALQKVRLTATALGVPAAVAGQVALFSFERFDPPPEYRSKQCHSSGDLDLHLDGAPGSWSY